MAEVLPMRVRFARIALVLFAVVYAACITIQVFLAGLSVFVDPIHWMQHTNFVHYFGLLPIPMLVLSFIGRSPNSIRWQLVALFALLFTMYSTAHLTPFLPMAAAAHPVLAMVMFWVAIRIVPRVWGMAFTLKT